MAEKTRILVVGCGGISGAWLRGAAALKNCSIVGLVDIAETNARTKAEQFGLDCFVGTDLKKALKETEPDVVFNCTVPPAHAATTIMALRHGCHVFTEKPLADTMTNARRMVQEAKKAKRIFAVMQNRRYDPNIRALVKFLRSGKIGDVTTVDCDFYIGAHFGGFRDRMKHVLLVDMAIHTFDAARLISGADPTGVYCHEWNPRGSWYDHDASAVAVFEMTDNIVYTYRGSWCSEGVNTTWECTWRIVGTKGTVTWDGGQTFIAEAIAGKVGFKRKLKALKVPVSRGPLVPQGGHAGAIKDFLACLRTGRKPETSGTDNIKSLAMVFGAVESAEKKRRVGIKA